MSPTPSDRAASVRHAVTTAVDMTAEELRIMKAYCERIWPHVGAAAPPPAAEGFCTRDVFAALSTAFSYWCAESLGSDLDFELREELLRSALFNTRLALEMKRRYQDLATTNEHQLAEIAALRARLELLDADWCGQIAKKRKPGAAATTTVVTPLKKSRTVTPTAPST